MNQLIRSLVLAVLFPLAAGCVNVVNPAFVKVTYDKPITTTSDKTARLELITGAVQGDSPYPSSLFNAQDQQVFTESLKEELLRLNLLRVLREGESTIKGTDILILLMFARTTHDRNLHDYQLDVAMEIRFADRAFKKRYQLLSSEGESIFIRMETNAAEGKAKAAKKLMAALIPDIEQFMKNQQ